MPSYLTMCPNSKLSALKMSDRTTLEFLDCYQSERCLWNPQHKRYRNRNARTAALKRIADNMDIEGFGPDLALQKFKNLRSSYCQELKKIRSSADMCSKSGFEGELPYKPTVVWFNKMDSFIRPFVQQRETRSAAVDQSPQTTSDVIDQADENEDRKSGIVLLTTEDIPATSTTTTTRPRPRRCNPTDDHDDPITKRTRSSDVCPIQQNHNFNDGLRCQSPADVKEDVHDIYGKYVAAVLRVLPSHRTFSLQRQFNELIYAEQMGSLADSSTGSTIRSGSSDLVECCILPSTPEIVMQDGC